MTPRRVPSWLLCAVCNRVAKKPKFVTARLREIVGPAQNVRARVCGVGDCEDRWRRTWDAGYATQRRLTEQTDA